MNLKQLLQSVQEMTTPLVPKGNRPSVTAAFKKVKRAAERQISGRTSDPKSESKQQAKDFFDKSKIPAKRA